MFLLRTIQRRLTTGFSLALVLVLALAIVGTLGLVWHQQTLGDLNYVLNEGPDRVGLENSFFGIDSAADDHSITAKRRPVSEIRSDFTAAVRKSANELADFRVRIEDLKQGTQKTKVGQHIVNMEKKLHGLLIEGHDLKKLDALPAPKQHTALTAFRANVKFKVFELLKSSQDLPAYEDRQLFSSSLDRQSKQSRRLLIAVACIAVGTMASIIIMWYFGFQWVSVPLLAVTRAASRIAEGDPDHRVPSVSQWDDEFSQLRTNVNLMAERAQDAERDLNRKVRERSQQLLRSERLAGLGVLAAGVAHEINNPLSIIRVAADTLDYRLSECLTEDNPDREQIFERLQMIRNESARCGEITARILDFARGEQTTAQVDDMTDIVESVLAMVRPMPTYRDREIIFKRTSPLHLLMNSSEIKQVLLNLIFNALQATGEGGRVEIRLIEQCDWVVLEVEDNGSGMSPKTIEQLFEPFYSTKPTGQGTGLGMCITHRIVEDHQGTIEPRNLGDGQGSLFRVRLPLRLSNRDVA